MSGTSPRHWSISVPLNAASLDQSSQLRADTGSNMIESFKALVAEAGNKRGGAFAGAPGAITDPEALIANWGGVTSDGGELRWAPPTSVPPAIAQHLQASLRQLNVLLRRGELVIDVDSNIRPGREA